MPRTPEDTPTIEYALYLESGPRRKKTMVHVLDLLGCVATGPTTEDALEATPAAIEAYRRLLARHGEGVPGGAFTTTIAEHITEGDWLGNGSPYLVFQPDLEPITRPEVGVLLRRYAAIAEELATWAERADGAMAAAKPTIGRANRDILLHALNVGGSLSAGLGGAPGFSALHGATVRGELPIPEAYRRSVEMVAERVGAATDEQLAAVLHRPKDIRTLRKALRQTLEHPWEHLLELSRRPGGPEL
jgi:predicted RNase H-like HicB family nuclease